MVLLIINIIKKDKKDGKFKFVAKTEFLDTGSFLEFLFLYF